MIGHRHLTRRAMLAAGLALPVLPGCDRMSAERTLRATDTHPDGYPTVEAVRYIARELDRRTNGRLGIKLYSGGQLGEERDTLELTVFGGIDFNRVNLAPLNAIARQTIVPTLPFLFRSERHMRKAMDGLPGKAILDSLRPHGLVGLCFYDSGARSFYTTDRMIAAPEDLKGLKIRVQNSDLFVAMVEALGGNATPMAYGEVYQGLMQGVVDGAENNWPSYESSRHFEAARFYSLTQHVMAPEVLVMSARRWEKLSQEDQSLVSELAQSSVPVMRKYWDERTLGAERRLREAGVQVNDTVDQAAFSARMVPVWDRFVTDPAMTRLVEDIQSMGGQDA